MLKINIGIIILVIFFIWINLITLLYNNEIIGSFNNLYSKEKKESKVLTLQYLVTKESFGISQGISVTNLLVSYEYPNKLRTESSGNIKTVEIYSGNRYIYYDNKNKKFIYKECFPKNIPNALEISLRLEKVIKGGEYEFFGYEEKENKKIKIIGIVSEDDNHTYMHKYWIETVKNINLPFREEYFIDNSVVCKTNYIYLNVNEPLDDKIFMLPN